MLSVLHVACSACCMLHAACTRLLALKCCCWRLVSMLSCRFRVELLHVDRLVSRALRSFCVFGPPAHCMLRVTLCVLHSVCYTVCVTLYVLHSVCCTLRVASCALPSLGVRCMLHAVRCMPLLQVAFFKLHGTSGVSHMLHIGVACFTDLLHFHGSCVSYCSYGSCCMLYLLRCTSCALQMPRRRLASHSHTPVSSPRPVVSFPAPPRHPPPLPPPLPIPAGPRPHRAPCAPSCTHRSPR
jgi:hypothetical protein